MPKTTTPQVTLHNAETGEIITRDANAEELAQIEADKEAAAVEAAEEEAKSTARQAILDRLGLTADEAALIVG
jgi:hypothetical protein